MPDAPTVQEPETNEFAADLAEAWAAGEKAANETPVEPDKSDDEGKSEKPKEDDKTDDPADPKDTEKSEEGTPPAKDAPKTEEDPKKAETPAKTDEAEEPKPLSKDDVTSIFANIRAEERASGKEVESTTNDVLEAYYPDGLSNVLVDQASGKELKTPQDVVDASGGSMSTEEAAQWLMNEQFKLDKNVEQIKDDARKIAETTINFKRDSITAVRKYEPLFKAYPKLQEKAFNLMMKQVKTDDEKGVVLSAPDVIDLYDDYLEPYQLAYEHSTKQPATNPPTPPASDKPADPAKPAAPGQADRLDEGGDGGVNAEVDDPNDFAQQVKKELSKPM